MIVTPQWHGKALAILAMFSSRLVCIVLFTDICFNTQVCCIFFSRLYSQWFIQWQYRTTQVGFPIACITSIPHLPFCPWNMKTIPVEYEQLFLEQYSLKFSKVHFHWYFFKWTQHDSAGDNHDDGVNIEQDRAGCYLMVVYYSSMAAHWTHQVTLCPHPR